MTRTTKTRRRQRSRARQRGRGTSALRGRGRGPRPARRSAALAAVRGENRRFQRRLPRAYSRFDDGHPGRRQIGSGGWADRGCHSNKPISPFGEAAPQAGEGPPRHPGSATHAALWARASAGSLLCCPGLYLGAKPQLDSAVAEVNDGTRHVVISALVETDAVAVRKPERIRDTLSVDQIFRGYEWGHPNKATAVDGSVRRHR